jgi:uncharacterized LabA/DUF88 family protein
LPLFRSQEEKVLQYRVACFIDGGYLDKVLRNEFSSAKIDYAKLAEWMAGGIPLLRTYYYHCLPYKSGTPTQDENERFSSMERFLNSLEKLPKFEVRKGKLEFRGWQGDGTQIYIQKRIDVLLAVDLTSLSAKGSITHAAILTGDSDYLPAIEMAKNQGVSICLFHGSKDKPHRELWQVCDERKAITADIIQIILR